MKQLTIGRHSDNDIVINDKKVSGHHCRIYEENGKCYIEDTNSTNGVIVDEVRISAPTQIVAESVITIPTKSFTGAELMHSLRVLGDSSLKNCLDIEAKYDSVEKRYQNNVDMLCNALRIESSPFNRVFDSLDEEIEYVVKEYDQKIEEAISMLRLISKASQMDVVSFRDDLDLLASLAHKAPENQKQECQEVRFRVLDKVAQLQKNLSNQVNKVVGQFMYHYNSIFGAHYETALEQDEKWQKVQNNQIVSVPFFVYGIRNMEFLLFEQTCIVCRMQIVPFLKRNNLIVRYDFSKASVAQDVVNGIIGRLLASSSSGNVQLHMFDAKDLGGTSNMLKMLDRHVYTICARTGDIQAQLSMLDRYVENVVQNLLQGPYTSLTAFNKGKEKQEPYQIVVFKEFPFGATPEIAHVIQRIIANGIRAGVQFIFMVNNDLLQNSEECIKIGNIASNRD